MESNFTEISNFHCPRWEELPDLELYMDQVVVILEKHLSVLTFQPEEKKITSTMINNYVKHRVIPAPVRKRYVKEHLANLMIVCIAKQVLSLSEVITLMKVVGRLGTIQQVYDMFCQELEQALVKTFSNAQLTTGYLQESSMEQELLTIMAQTFANKLYLQIILMEQEAKIKAKAKEKK